MGGFLVVKIWDKVKRKKMSHIVVTLVSLPLYYLISVLMSVFLKTPVINVYWFFPIVLILCGLIYGYLEKSLTVRPFPFFFFVSSYGVLLFNLTSSGDYNSLMFSIIYISLMLLGLSTLRPKGFTFFQFYLIFLEVVLFIGMGREFGPDEKMALPIVLGTFLFFSLLNIYLHSVKKSLKEKVINLEEFSQRLNELVQTMTAEVHNQNKNFKVLLSNIDHGFLVIDRDGSIVGETTDVTEKIFRVKPKGKKIKEVLQFDINENKNFDRWLDHVYKGMVHFNDILDLAPKTFTKNQGSVVSLDFRPLYKNNENKEVDKIICIATDIKNKVHLKKKALKEKTKLFSILAIIDRPLEFLDLVSDAEDIILSYMDSNAHDLDIDIVYRHFHTLKAGFGSFKIDDVVRRIHELETYFNQYKEKNKTLNKIPKDLLFLIENINRELRYFIKENRKIIELVNSNLNFSEDFQETLSLKKEVQSFVSNFHRNFILKNIDVYFKRYVPHIEELSSRQDKEVIYKINKSNIYVNLEGYRRLFSTLIHIFRNAIDHGIETREERKVKKKKRAATIEIKFNDFDNGRFQIIISDDGRGINPTVIRKSASAKVLFKNLDINSIPAKKVINLIFEPGFSSKDIVTEVSGRGVGMDVIKTEVKKIGGDISVESKVDVGTTFIIDLPKIT